MVALDYGNQAFLNSISLHLEEIPRRILQLSISSATTMIMLSTLSLPEPFLYPDLLFLSSNSLNRLLYLLNHLHSTAAITVSQAKGCLSCPPRHHRRNHSPKRRRGRSSDL
jgi:hypothetical protein